MSFCACFGELFKERPGFLLFAAGRLLLLLLLLLLCAGKQVPVINHRYMKYQLFSLMVRLTTRSWLDAQVEEVAGLAVVCVSECSVLRLIGESCCYDSERERDKCSGVEHQQSGQRM